MDSVKTEGQDYIRAGLPAPDPIILTNHLHGEFSHALAAGAPDPIYLPSYLHGEFSHALAAGAPDPIYLPSYLHGEFSHMFESRERATWASLQLPNNYLTESITSGYSNA